MSKIKKKYLEIFLWQNFWKKKLVLNTVIVVKYHMWKTYIHTYTHPYTYRLFLKTGFLASLGLKTRLNAKKSKIKMSPTTIVPLWGTKNFFIGNRLKWNETYFYWSESFWIALKPQKIFYQKSFQIIRNVFLLIWIVLNSSETAY